MRCLHAWLFLDFHRRAWLPPGSRGPPALGGGAPLGLPAPLT